MFSYNFYCADYMASKSSASRGKIRVNLPLRMSIMHSNSVIWSNYSMRQKNLISKCGSRRSLQDRRYVYTIVNVGLSAGRTFSSNSNQVIELRL